MAAEHQTSTRSTSSPSTRSARSRSTRSRRRTRGTPGRRWRWRRSPTCSGSASCASTPRSRSGPTATASCSRPATPRCCSTRCCTSPACEAVDPDYEIEGRESVTLDDIKSFRQLDSKAAGHPEYRWTSGVETTTGPLGQGIATSVGMAVAAKWQAAHFNRPGFELFDFDTYAIAGDGCLMEGVSHEAASFAGHQRLDNLCWIYDNNHITIDGHTEITYDDDVAGPLHGLRLERDHGSATPTTSAQITARVRDLQGDRGPPDADHRRQPHRLRLAAQAGHRRRPRRAAGRGGGARDQALLRLARGRRSSWSPTASPSTSPTASAPAAPSSAREWEKLLVSYQREHESLERRDRRDAAPRAARRLGSRHPHRSSPTRRGSRPARPRTRSRTRSPSRCPWLLSRLRRPHRLDLGPAHRR